MVLNYERLLDSCDNDYELVQEVIAEYFSATAETIEKLELALLADSADQVRFQAHSLKGSSRTIGAEDLGSVCAKLEERSKEGDLSQAAVLLERIKQEYDVAQVILHSYLQDKAA